MIKIYYAECDDNYLLERMQCYINEPCYWFKRGNGYVNNYFDYEDFKEWLSTTSHEEYHNMYSSGVTILTNDLDVLEYGKDDTWNQETKRFEIYLRSHDDEFVNIHDLTDKAIRKSHNIRKMYINGAFRK